uniref:Sushi domain-containing protein n=1 Tax=Athene cunicularia TaxID=194338 RepID=A0A663M080_ATHCN
MGQKRSFRLLHPPCTSTTSSPLRPKDVANAHIDADNNLLLNTNLRYTCNPGYKRQAGTSSLIQCVLPEGSSKPDWTQTTLKCIRKPSLGFLCRRGCWALEWAAQGRGESPGSLEALKSRAEPALRDLGELGTVRGRAMVGLEELQGLFQPGWFWDSVAL